MTTTATSPTPPPAHNGSEQAWLEEELNGGVRAFRGLMFATLLSIPVWAVVIFVAIQLFR